MDQAFLSGFYQSISEGQLSGYEIMTYGRRHSNAVNQIVNKLKILLSVLFSIGTGMIPFSSTPHPRILRQMALLGFNASSNDDDSTGVEDGETATFSKS